MPKKAKGTIAGKITQSLFLAVVWFIAVAVYSEAAGESAAETGYLVITGLCLAIWVFILKRGGRTGLKAGDRHIMHSDDYTDVDGDFDDD